MYHWRLLCVNVEFTPFSSTRNLRDSASIRTTLASIQLLAPPSRRTTTNCSSSFSHMSRTRHERPARIASNAKVKQDEGGTEDGIPVSQETVERSQSYAFRPTGKRKRYKSKGTSEGRCNCSNTSRRRFFHLGSASITRNGRAFRAIRQIKNYCYPVIQKNQILQGLQLQMLSLPRRSRRQSKWNSINLTQNPQIGGLCTRR